MLVNYMDPGHGSTIGDIDGILFYQERKLTRQGHDNDQRDCGNNGGGRGCISDPSHSTNHPSNFTDDVEPTNATSLLSEPYLYQRSVQYSQSQRNSHIPPTWLLADSCSFMDIISSKVLLQKIHKA
jgi:hypothetical protein